MRDCALKSHREGEAATQMPIERGRIGCTASESPEGARGPLQSFAFAIAKARGAFNAGESWLSFYEAKQAAYTELVAALPEIREVQDFWRYVQNMSPAAWLPIVEREVTRMTRTKSTRADWPKISRPGTETLTLGRWDELTTPEGRLTVAPADFWQLASGRTHSRVYPKTGVKCYACEKNIMAWSDLPALAEKRAGVPAKQKAWVCPDCCAFYVPLHPPPYLPRRLNPEDKQRPGWKCSECQTNLVSARNAKFCRACAATKKREANKASKRRKSAFISASVSTAQNADFGLSAVMSQNPLFAPNFAPRKSA
jgi:hypothetical protein